MDRFGSDKPDIRFGLELVDISDIVKNCGFKVLKGQSKMEEVCGALMQKLVELFKKANRCFSGGWKDLWC